MGEGRTLGKARADGTSWGAGLLLPPNHHPYIKWWPASLLGCLVPRKTRCCPKQGNDFHKDWCSQSVACTQKVQGNGVQGAVGNAGKKLDFPAFPTLGSGPAPPAGQSLSLRLPFQFPTSFPWIPPPGCVRQCQVGAEPRAALQARKALTTREV